MSNRPIVVLPGLTPGLSGLPVHAQLAGSVDAGAVLDGARLLIEAAESSAPALDALVTRIAAHFDEAGLEEVVLVAEGYAATLALRFAACRPECVRELVAVAPLGYISPLSGPGRGLAVLAGAIRRLYSGRPADVRAALFALGTPEGSGEDLVEEYVSTADDRVRRAAVGLAEMVEAGVFDLTRRPDGDGLRDVRRPVTLVWGRDDVWAPLDSAFYLERRLRDAQLRVVPNVGHLVAQQWGPGLVRYVSAAVLTKRTAEDEQTTTVSARSGELIARSGA